MMRTSYARSVRAARITRGTGPLCLIAAVAYLFHLDVVEFLWSFALTAFIGILVIALSDGIGDYLGATAGYTLGLGVAVVTVSGPSHDLLLLVTSLTAGAFAIGLGLFISSHYDSSWTLFGGVTGTVVGLTILYGVIPV